MRNQNGFVRLLLPLRDGGLKSLKEIFPDRKSIGGTDSKLARSAVAAGYVEVQGEYPMRFKITQSGLEMLPQPTQAEQTISSVKEKLQKSVWQYGLDLSSIPSDLKTMQAIVSILNGAGYAEVGLTGRQVPEAP